MQKTVTLTSPYSYKVDPSAGCDPAPFAYSAQSMVMCSEKYSHRYNCISHVHVNPDLPPASPHIYAYINNHLHWVIGTALICSSYQDARSKQLLSSIRAGVLPCAR